MDRVIVYPGAIPLETDILATNKFAMIALGKLAEGVIGSNQIIRGLSVVPTGPASMQVVVNPGEIYSLSNIDATAYSTLAADTAHTLVKQGLKYDASNITLSAPTTSGQSVVYLIQARFVEVDGGATVLPYYNAANPSQGFSGPNNTGISQNTVRRGTVDVSAKAGVAANTGSQVEPSPDSGYSPVAIVTVANGQTTITSSNIGAPNNYVGLTEPLPQKLGIAQADSRYALKAGSASQTFSVAAATLNSHAAQLAQIFGVGQTWQDFSSTRLVNTTYTNSTGKTIAVSGYLQNTGSAVSSIQVNGVVISNYTAASGAPAMPFFMIVPNNNTYAVQITSGTVSSQLNWAELR